MLNRRHFLLAPGAAALAADAPHSRWVYPGRDGRLVYTPDERGNTIPDFSNCGYRGGGVALPTFPVAAEVAPGAGDAGERIQAAIDKVSRLPLRGGVRGAVLLRKGRYPVEGTLRIAASGVALRGEGSSEDGSVLVGTGRRQRNLVEVRGDGEPIPSAEPVKIRDPYVPVGARRFRVTSARGLRPGQFVLVRRHGNADWIHAIAMDRIQPRPGDPHSTRQWQPFDLDFHRVVTAVDGDRVTVDAPLTCAIEDRWGGGELIPCRDERRIRNCGIEFLRGVSEFDRSVTALYGRQKERYFSDEQHCWSFLGIRDAVNAWARGLAAVHMGMSSVGIARSLWVTVTECSCVEMVSVIDGGRRYPYNVSGQLCLVERSTADTARHDFAVGSRVCGPNVFLECRAGRSFDTSEPHHRWSVGGLYDNVKANIAVQDRQYYGTGHGWAGANYVLWNCEGSLVCQNPPTARNWSIGHVGLKQPGAFAPRPDGEWESPGRHVEPRSLYRKQLEERMGRR